MTPRTRQGLVWGGLAATLAAVAGVDALPGGEPVAPVAAARSHGRAATPRAAVRAPWPDAPAGALVAWGQPGRPDPAPAAAAPVEPAEPVAAPPAPPAAPLPPYRWIGRIEEDGHTRALLAGATRTVLVGDGEVIDGQWRIEHVGERDLELTWLPGPVAQRLGPAS